MNSHSLPPQIRPKELNRWAELRTVDSLYKNAVRNKAELLKQTPKGTRVFMLQKLGSFYKVKMEDGFQGWLYKPIFSFLD